MMETVRCVISREVNMDAIRRKVEYFLRHDDIYGIQSSDDPIGSALEDIFEDTTLLFEPDLGSDEDLCALKEAVRKRLGPVGLQMQMDLHYQKEPHRYEDDWI